MECSARGSRIIVLATYKIMSLILIMRSLCVQRADIHGERKSRTQTQNPRTDCRRKGRPVIETEYHAEAEIGIKLSKRPGQNIASSRVAWPTYLPVIRFCSCGSCEINVTVQSDKIWERAYRFIGLGKHRGDLLGGTFRAVLMELDVGDARNWP